MKNNILVTGLFALLITMVCMSSLLWSQESDYYDLYLRTGGSWQMIVKDFTVSTDTWTRDRKLLPGKYFHGAQTTDKSRQPGPVVLHVDYPVAGEFIFYVETVSGNSSIKVLLDNREAKTFNLLTGPMGEGPWIASRKTGENNYQCDYYQEFKINIPAGKHDISIQNMGADWVSINYFIFTNYADKIMDQEYQAWKEYKTTLTTIEARLADYEKSAQTYATMRPGDTNYDLLPTMHLQLENFRHLAENHTAVDYHLLRTETELKEIFDYLNSGKDYFKTKRGRIKTGYQSNIDDSYQPFDLIVPQNFSPAKQYALEVDLHGYQVELRKYSNLVGDDKSGTLDSLGIIRAAVYGRRNHQYRGAAEQDVHDVIDIIQSRYSIDPDRVYLMGSSMGGYGTWYNALTHPDKFAAISPVCPPSDISDTRYMTTVSPVEYAVNALHLPSRIYHGDSDPTVNVNDSREMVKRLKKLDYEHVYFELPGVGHDAWNNASADQERRPWLLQYKRNQYPKNVKYKMFYLKHGKAYWLTVTGKTDWNDFGEIDAEISGQNEITIHTKNISAFTIDLKHPALEADKPITVKIDKCAHIVSKGGTETGFYLLDSKWLNGKLPVNGLVKRVGLEGPMVEIETGKFLIVYGTGDPNKVDLLKKMGTIIQNNYAVSDMDIKLLPDSKVIEKELAKTHNLYLLGDPNENMYLKKIIDGLPLSFTDKELNLNKSYDRENIGVQMIYPNPAQPDKYVLIDVYPKSLTDSEDAPTIPVADYMIYKYKDANFEMLKEGYFDPYWQVAE